MAEIANAPMKRRSLGVSKLSGNDANSRNSWKIAVPWVENAGGLAGIRCIIA
jgi:hypothetical protein